MRMPASVRSRGQSCENWRSRVRRRQFPANTAALVRDHGAESGKATHTQQFLGCDAAVGMLPFRRGYPIVEFVVAI